MRLALAPLCAILTLSPACAGREKANAAPAPAAAPDWRSIITTDDNERVHDWRDAWTKALAKAQASGHGAELAAEGRLLDPDGALPWKDPPPGIYRCRTIKIGAKSQGMLDYVAYPPFDCRIRVEDGIVSFAKLSGSQRPVGLLLPYADNRMIFLGTLQLGDERRALEYGRDQERDLVAVLERIGDARWRLVFPYPHFESTVDVIELVPAPAS